MLKFYNITLNRYIKDFATAGILTQDVYIKPGHVLEWDINYRYSWCFK